MASVLRELALGDESLPAFLELLKYPENE